MPTLIWEKFLSATFQTSQSGFLSASWFSLAYSLLCCFRVNSAYLKTLTSSRENPWFCSGSSLFEQCCPVSIKLLPLLWLPFFKVLHSLPGPFTIKPSRGSLCWLDHIWLQLAKLHLLSMKPFKMDLLPHHPADLFIFFPHCRLCTNFYWWSAIYWPLMAFQKGLPAVIQFAGRHTMLNTRFWLSSQ